MITLFVERTATSATGGSAMNMGFSLGCSQEQRCEQRLEQRLAPEQRLEIEEAELGLRFELASALHDDNFKPEARCPKCGYGLTLRDILRGFKNDPKDFTTECPTCKERFPAELVVRSSYSSGHLYFLCPAQTKARFDGKHQLAPEQLQKFDPSAYRSALFHFGSVGKMFTEMGFSYGFPDEIEDWKKKVEPFLGKLPDTVIYLYLEGHGIRLRDIRKLRKRLNIPVYRKETD